MSTRQRHPQRIIEQVHQVSASLNQIWLSDQYDGRSLQRRHSHSVNIKNHHCNDGPSFWKEKFPYLWSVRERPQMRIAKYV
ncbi:uncharacterized protein SETTUDRAFT_165633 [Exserohilum turcica Et28A]|uniref:Uncharacterized protein n=1 Tax=Exserohilum turcicum (strain 28A) TaxID=671987 RepID=R0IA43_EXST2|nr:uncharacterized protein SETTUDRAFT_165633 [Exserohilum turcica Et28A]EOA82186.1 hypothetical protein SETTUDRAFT_165633 [Exserohilum turcica Et28A]